MAEFRFPLPTDTTHVRIESRQYRIFKLDLGEGVPRRKLAVGAAIIAPYWLILGVIFHLSPLGGPRQRRYRLHRPGGVAGVPGVAAG